MRKTLLVLATIALAVVAVPSALAKSAAKTPPPKVTTVKLLAFNDFHGHLEANTPGTIRPGAAFRTRRLALLRRSRSRPAAPSTSQHT